MQPAGDAIEVCDVPVLPRRAADAHKGTFGKALVVAGSRGMSGAAVLAGTAALRGGAGLVQLAVPEGIAAIVAAAQPCYMAAPLPEDAAGRLAVDAVARLADLAGTADSVVLGPGLGQSLAIRQVIEDLVGRLTQPILLDADALNVLGAEPACLATRQAPLVLTPHPGEFARLSGTGPREVQASRLERAITFARRHHCVLLLKGAGTLITDGQRYHVNTTGNPGMATGGSGDVLSGLIGALLAGGLDPFAAAVLGAHVHGLAGDLARDRLGETALIATDLLDHLPAAFGRLAAGDAG